MKRKDFEEKLEKMFDRVDEVLERSQPPMFDEFTDLILDNVEKTMAGTGPGFNKEIPIRFNYGDYAPKDYILKFLSFWMSTEIDNDFNIDFATDGSWMIIQITDLMSEDIEEDSMN